MRTTIRLDDDLLREAKKRATEAGMSLTALIEDSLRERLYRAGERDRRAEPVRLRTTGRGGVRPGVDLDDSVSLLEAMDGRG